MSIYVDDGRMTVTTWPFVVSYPFVNGTNLVQVDERVTHYKEKDSGGLIAAKSQWSSTQSC